VKKAQTATCGSAGRQTVPVNSGSSDTQLLPQKSMSELLFTDSSSYLCVALVCPYSSLSPK